MGFTEHFGLRFDYVILPKHYMLTDLVSSYNNRNFAQNREKFESSQEI